MLACSDQFHNGIFNFSNYDSIADLTGPLTNPVWIARHYIRTKFVIDKNTDADLFSANSFNNKSYTFNNNCSISKPSETHATKRIIM